MQHEKKHCKKFASSPKQWITIYQLCGTSVLVYMRHNRWKSAKKKTCQDGEDEEELDRFERAIRAHDRHGNRRVNNQPAGWFRTTFRPNRNRSPTEPFASLWWVKVFPGESHSWAELNSIHMCKNTKDCYRALCVGFFETYFRSVHPVLHAAWLDTLFVYFCPAALALLLSHCPMTVVQSGCMDFTGFGAARNVVSVPKVVTKQMTPLERELEAVEGISLHQFNQPVAEVVGRVSIVTPTTASRARFHPQLWQCFLDQSWPDKELVVVETYHNEPSAFFESIARVDSRLKYVAIKRPVGEDLTVGAKRNATILMASGQYIVNFDDDDLYANRYVESMVTQMQRRNLVALTLSGWHNFFEARGSAGYSEPKSWDPEDEDEMDEILYGYGFSYVHLRVMAMFYPYPNLAFAEDAPFMLKLREKMGDGRVGLLEDVEGLCLHIVHSKSSTPDPDISHELTEHQLSRLAVSDTNGFDLFMEGYSRSFSWFTGIFASLFHFWSSCWSDLWTCRWDQIDFTIFWFHHKKHSRNPLVKEAPFLISQFGSGSPFFFRSEQEPGAATHLGGLALDF